MPDVVDADADGHIGGLEFDHVGIEPSHEIFGLLAADALVDQLGEFHGGILQGEHAIDVAEVPARRGDRVADGHNLVAGLQLQLLGCVRRSGTEENQDQGENIVEGGLHARDSMGWAEGGEDGKRDSALYYVASSPVVQLLGPLRIGGCQCCTNGFVTVPKGTAESSMPGRTEPRSGQAGARSRLGKQVHGE